MPRLLLSALLLSLTACGGGGPGPLDASAPGNDAGRTDAGVEDAGHPDAGFVEVPVDRWCQTQAQVLCARDVRCSRLESARVDTCIQRQLQSCQAQARVRGVTAGRLQYFANHAAACLNATFDGPCDGVPAECDGLFQGLVAPGGDCLLAEECQLGAYCLTYESRCPYRCYAYAPLGASCDFWQAQCDPEQARCADVDAGVRSCLPRAGVGEPCVYWSDCREALACVEVQPSQRQCVPRVSGPGEPCAVYSGYPGCEADFFCRQPPGANDTLLPGTCQRRQGLGGACTSSASCLPGLRCSHLSQTGTCIPLGTQAARCGSFGECQGELFCAAKTSSCAPLPTEGGDCGITGSSYRCALGHYCDYEEESCRRTREVGTPCAYGEECTFGSCEYGRAPDGGVGYTCTIPCAQRPDAGP